MLIIPQSLNILFNFPGFKAFKEGFKIRDNTKKQETIIADLNRGA